MNYKQILLTVVIISIMCGVADAAWANTSYTHAKNITLLGADTELTNFPYLVSVAKESAMQADFDDLIFYDQPVYGGGNLIDFEIETYNATTATVWLNITTLPTTGKTVSMYYGNAAASSTADSNATWDSDYVGVWHMSDNVSIGHTVWNDYKQPDGVLNATEVVGPNTAGIQEVSVYYIDGEFKLWGHIDNGSVQELGYFNSSNGYNWTYQGSARSQNGAIITNVARPFVMPDPNSTGYWLYVNNQTGHDIEDLWYSTNGIDWTIDSLGIFSASDVGGASQLGNVMVWCENTSDWYMICENNAPAWTSDYATSNDGKSWTFHGQVTVSGFGSNGLSGPWITKNDGTYYMLFHGNRGNDGGIPSDIYVATSTDRQSWVYQNGYGITREYYWEGGGSSSGQVADPHLLEHNNEVYIYYEGLHEQAAPYPFRVGLVHLNQTLQEVLDEIDGGVNVPTVTDSTGQNDGWLDGYATSSSGIVGKDMIFTTTDHIQIPSSDFYNVGTLSYWMNASSITSTHMIFSGNENTTDSHNYIGFGVDDGSAWCSCLRYAGAGEPSKLASNTDIITVQKPCYVVWTSNGTTTSCFVDGSNVQLNVVYGGNYGGWFSDIPNVDKYGISSRKRQAQQYDRYEGGIDEVELSKSVRSDDWINLSYQMVVNNTYVTFGAEQTYGGSGGGAYNITLPLGWSIIGWTSATPTTAHSMGGMIGGNCTFVTERNATTGEYVTHVMAGAEDEDNFAINRGWGYFVKLSAETLWERDS